MTYIKNKFKRDKRVATKREEKQIKSLYNSIYRESQLLTNVVNLTNIFIKNNLDFHFRSHDFINIVRQISSEISPIPLSTAAIEHGAKQSEDYYKKLLKEKNNEKKENNNK